MIEVVIKEGALVALGVVMILLSPLRPKSGNFPIHSYKTKPSNDQRLDEATISLQEGRNSMIQVNIIGIRDSGSSTASLSNKA